MKQVFDLLVGLDVISDSVAVSMKNAVGFRNIAVHCYDDLNLDIVYAICTKRLGDFKNFVKEVYLFVELFVDSENN